MEKELIQQTALLEFQPRISICFISKGSVINVPIADITHVSKYGNETVIYTAPSKSPPEGGDLRRICNEYRTCMSLQEIMNDLPVNEFFRVHRSHIVAVKYMNGVERKRIMGGEYYVPMSNYYKAQLIKRLGEKLDSEYEFFTSQK